MSRKLNPFYLKKLRLVNSSLPPSSLMSITNLSGARGHLTNAIKYRVSKGHLLFTVWMGLICHHRLDKGLYRTMNILYSMTSNSMSPL